ncbi:MAG TPA: DNA-processing protein DprA [Geobacteraceae bacterium]
MTMSESYYWFALKSVPLVGTITCRRLVEQFGSPERVLRASAAELARVPGVGPALIASLAGHPYQEQAERECAAVERHGVRIVTMLDPDYPPLLREIADAPPFLYVVGDLPSTERSLAVVGSRHASSYGLATTARLTRELAEAGVAIISGMARGVDAAAHRAALAAGGSTIGVLGCGVDLTYPQENRALFQEMRSKGALISEFPMATPPAAENFPRRNRLISGLSRGVLVVEAAEQSGSLITAGCALEQNREVFAVPGNITNRASRGSNSLIKQGAKLVAECSDIFEELPQLGRRRVAAVPGSSLPPDEARICGLMDDGPCHIDELVVRSGLTVGELSAMLLRLELQGVILQLPGKMFAMT